ncbi:hypothetical protein [Bradyrhizobium sp. USDA 4506]
MVSRKLKEPVEEALNAINQALKIADGDERREQAKLMLDVTAIFTEAGWEVLQLPAKGRTAFSADLIVSRIDLGQERRYGIECTPTIDKGKIEEHRRRFRKWVREVTYPRQMFDDYWLVGYEYADAVNRRNPDNDRHFRTFDLRELRALVATPRKKAIKSRTKIGKAVEANTKAIQVAIAALMLQIEGKLVVLRDDRPNSLEAVATRDAQIAEYDAMRVELENIRIAVIEYVKGKGKETEVVKSVVTFKQGLQSWWSKRHDNICDNASAGGLFLGSAGLLHLMNADSTIALAIAGTIIGGEAVVKALKALPRRLF